MVFVVVVVVVVVSIEVCYFPFAIMTNVNNII
jgi:hypothetical protein